MENHFDKLIKIIESCETPDQFSIKFINWAYQALDCMQKNLTHEEYIQHINLLTSTLKKKNQEIHAQTNHISGTGSIG